MPIVANNIKVGAVQPPSKKESEFSFKKIKENIKKEFDPDFKPKQVVKKDLTEVNLNPPTVSKPLPKYLSKKEGELTTKVNTKSQYMRDIFDLDS